MEDLPPQLRAEVEEALFAGVDAEVRAARVARWAWPTLVFAVLTCVVLVVRVLVDDTVRLDGWTIGPVIAIAAAVLLVDLAVDDAHERLTR